MIATHGDITLVGSGKSAAIVIAKTAATPAGKVSSPNFNEPSAQDTDSSTEWAKWGSDNAMPNKEYTKYTKKTGVLGSGTDLIARIAVGRGPTPVVIEDIDTEGNEKIRIINDPEIAQWLIDNNATMFSYATILDTLRTGHCWTQYVCNRAGDYINRMKRLDVSTCRFGKRSASGKIETTFVSYEWGRGTPSKEDKTLIQLPLLDIENPVESILDADNNVRLPYGQFTVASHYPVFGTQYYAQPLWYSVKAWCDIAMGVPEMKAFMFNNQMTIKYVIEIDDNYWQSRWRGWNGFTDEDRANKRKIVMKELDEWLSGNENAYKNFIVPMRPNPGTGESTPLAKITPLDDKIKDGKLLPDSAAANSEILFAIALNPALLGVDMPGGMYGGGKGGSNIREAFMVQILIREIERGYVANALNVVSRANGWAKRYPGLQWRFPNHYLTTLDSGKNAKPIL